MSRTPHDRASEIADSKCLWIWSITEEYKSFPNGLGITCGSRGDWGGRVSEKSKISQVVFEMIVSRGFRCLTYRTKSKRASGKTLNL